MLIYQAMHLGAIKLLSSLIKSNKGVGVGGVAVLLLFKGECEKYTRSCVNI